LRLSRTDRPGPFDPEVINVEFRSVFSSYGPKAEDVINLYSHETNNPNTKGHESEREN